MSDESQRKTDYERGLADARASLHRYAPLEANPNPILVNPKLGLPYTGPHPDDWEGWLERRKQIDREEKRAFNEKYGYAQ